MAWFKPWLRLLFLTRYSVLVGLAGPVLIPLAAAAKPDLLGSFLVLEDPWQLFNVTWLSLMLAVFVLVSFRLTQVNAPARFADLRADYEEISAAQSLSRAETAAIVPRRVRVRRDSPMLVGATAGEIETRHRVAADKWHSSDVGSTASNSGHASPLNNSHGHIAPTAATLATHRGWKYRWLLLAVMGMTLPIVCVIRTSQDLSPTWTTGSISAGVLGAVAILGGLAVAMLLLGIMLVIQQLLIDPEAISSDLLPFELWPWLTHLKQLRVAKVNSCQRSVARVMNWFGPGYTQRGRQSGQLIMAPGHPQSALWMTFLIGVYFYSYRGILSSRNIPSESGPLSILFFLLMVIFFFHGILTGLSFFLDYYRVPTLLAFVGLSVVSSSLFDTSSVYELNPRLEPDRLADAPPPKADLELKGLFDDWKPPKRTLVVVSAAGGGIQAAAWTTQVLAGLDEIYGPDFTRSIGIVSGVSGGSVGTMYFMVAGDWVANGPPLSAKAREQMIAAAEGSCMEATGWGFAYPDLMRTFLPFLVPRQIDRGWAIEQAWHSRIGHDLRLRDWITPIRKHQMPIPVFNAVLAETGQRFVISPVVKQKLKRWHSTDACEFFNLYPDDTANPRVTTAVRLSATFPYVSPISRADADADPKLARNCYHVADGGYVDSEGLFTIVDWIGELAGEYNNRPKARPFDTILVIRVQPFSIKWRADSAQLRESWTYDLLGPLETIQNARGASQAERNSFDLNLVTSAAAADREKNPDAIQIVWTNFMFHPDEHYTPPMSWHLTASQKHEVSEAWKDLVTNWDRPERPQQAELGPIPNRRREPPLKTVDKFFTRVKAPPP